MGNKASAKLIYLVGEDWLNEQIQLADTKSVGVRKQFHPQNIRRRVKHHPLVLMKMSLNGFLMRMEMAGLDEFPADANLSKLQTIEANLNALWDTLDVDYLSKRLRDENEFRSVLYELHIAASYVRSGRKSRLIPPDKIRTPDIAVEIPQIGNDLVIEAKQKELSASEKNENNLFGFFQYRLHEEIERKGVSAGVIIELLKPISEVDLTNLVKKIKDSLGAPVMRLEDEDFISEIETFGGIDSKIEYSKVAKYLENIFDMGSSRMEVKSLIEKPDFVIGPRYIRVNNRSEHWIYKLYDSIENSVKKAARQLYEDVPGLIYVEIGKRSRRNSALVLNQAKIKLQNVLERNKRISGVVLTTLGWTDVVGGALYLVGNEYIKNLNARNPIPSDFVVIGSKDHTFGDDIMSALPGFKISRKSVW